MAQINIVLAFSAFIVNGIRQWHWRNQAWRAALTLETEKIVIGSIDFQHCMLSVWEANCMLHHTDL